MDDLATRYDGLLEDTIALHEIGDGKDLKGMPALEVRRHHMTLIAKLVEQLKSSPEGNGSMFDKKVRSRKIQTNKIHSRNAS